MATLTRDHTIAQLHSATINVLKMTSDGQRAWSAGEDRCVKGWEWNHAKQQAPQQTMVRMSSL